MKVKDLIIAIPTLKPRNSAYAILAAKKNAAGSHRDKKRELKLGCMKHRTLNTRHCGGYE